MSMMNSIEKGFSRVNSRVFKRVNRSRDWWELPKVAALLNLRAFRDEMRQTNLYDGGNGGGASSVDVSGELPKYRTYDGSLQDPNDPDMGRVGSRFGRNLSPDATDRETGPRFMQPNPREVSLRLLTRDTFKPATSLNVLAACWIQFQNHDWFGHGENDPDSHLEIPVPDGDDWPENPMKVRQTSPDRTSMENGDAVHPTYINTVTHWWDGSQIYGSDEERNRKLRSGEDGKLLVEDSRLPNEDNPKLDGVDLTGFSDNYWIGLSLLHTLFVKEHNAICDYLKGVYPTWDDERLFLTARLVNSALLAKIHTVEWTPGILANPVLERAMHANWYGLLPRWVRQRFGHVGTEMIGGVVGSDQEHHAAPYAITEEFISVYRLHPLLPDDYEIRDHRNGQLIEATDFEPIQGHGTRPSIDKWGMTNLLYSFGTANPGAITLHNHPRALQNHVRLTGERVDLGTIDILRDRERGVARYNEFREKLHKRRVERFEDLTDNAEWAAEIRDVYDGEIDRVDLQVGLLAEPLPPGFGFSDTAFRIFILMASRRLKSDRFFTNDYSPDVYTPEGLDWVERNTMTDVLLRHHPELAPALDGVANAFAPWRKLS
jgi:hypothetical protein